MPRSAKVLGFIMCVVVVGGTELSSARKPATDSPRLVAFEPYEEEGASRAWDDTLGQPVSQPFAAVDALQARAVAALREEVNS